jgi:hypothetical protein
MDKRWHCSISSPTVNLVGTATFSSTQNCGIYGVNGGYFDKSLKFGVNWFRIKPHKRDIDALSIELDPLATSKETESEVEDARSQELKRVPILLTREISPHPPHWFSRRCVTQRT